MTRRGTWKQRERDAAALFGHKRQPLSGSSGRDDLTRSDANHSKLFLETKLRDKTWVQKVWEATKTQARREGKTPVVVLFDKGKVGGLVVVHADDLAAVAAELASVIIADQEVSSSTLDTDPPADMVDMVPTNA